MAYFATQYTIHFDDTMAYGSHHFLTSFKFQCAARESFLFGERLFDVVGVREALDRIHLFTADAYARNLNPAMLGDRVAILMTLEEWGRISARFCYRVINAKGQPVCAGFQTLICADRTTGKPIPIPSPIWQAMEAMRSIEESAASESFRDRVLAGGQKVESLFGPVERESAIQFLTQRYPHPQVIAPDEGQPTPAQPSRGKDRPAAVAEAWVFAGQGAFDPHLLCERVGLLKRSRSPAREDLDDCVDIVRDVLGMDATALVSGSVDRCRDAVREAPDLSQVAIHLQNILGASIRWNLNERPVVLMGHSFGEIAAFGFGGWFDVTTGVRIVCERIRAIRLHAPKDGGLLAVGSDPDSIAIEIVLRHLHQLVIAGRNHRTQTVVSGPLDQLQELSRGLRDRRIAATTIESPTSFHHPSLRQAAQSWYESLCKLSFRTPTCRIYSPIGRRYVSDSDDVAATLASQLLRPFDFLGSVRDLRSAGIKKFTDCGSSRSLARLIALADSWDDEHTASNGHTDDRVIPNDASFVAPSDIVRTHHPKSVVEPRSERPQPRTEGGTSPQIAESRIGIVAQGCILPGGAASPDLLFTAIDDARIGIIDQRDHDPHWSADFYSEKLLPDRSTSHLTGGVNDADIVPPPGIDVGVFLRFTRTQQLLCIALAPCVSALQGADRVLCLVGATADGFEDQDEVSSLRFMGIDPSDPIVRERVTSIRSVTHEPHDAVQEVFDLIVRPGLEIRLIDAACASSLYSVALGMHALEANKADALIAGGLFCPGPGNSCLFSQFHGTTSTGCRPFDATADGVVFSEGAAFVVLRRVVDAERLQLPISAIVVGAGLSSDGKSSSANVPQSKGQLLSLDRCYNNYRIDRSTIDGIEGHGTSTPVGDGTELETLRTFFGPSATRPIPLHSLKGVLGHAGWAAGTASIIAACEYLRRGHFPAQACHREPSESLKRSKDTLVVPNPPVLLGLDQCRIAVDGFGFGGANAHLVLERYVTRNGVGVLPRSKISKPTHLDEDLVVVACHEIVPTLRTAQGIRFDRQGVGLSSKHVVLPDVADDMDITQTLAVSLVDGLVAQLGLFDDPMRRVTSVILAHSGKTDRGIEATARILAQRYRRTFAGCDSFLEAIADTIARTRPSGPYTLQCMMPNVATGRAALQHDLNGPNFVVDAGVDSLAATFEAASLLLEARKRSGTEIVFVLAIEACRWRLSHGMPEVTGDEYAAAFALTSRQYAKERGFPIVADYDIGWHSTRRNESPPESPVDRVRAIVDTCTGKTKDQPLTVPDRVANHTTQDHHPAPLHAPVWVVAPLPESPVTMEIDRSRATIYVVPADHDLVLELAATLQTPGSRFLLAIVGKASAQLAERLGDRRIISVESMDGPATDALLSEIDRFRAEAVVGIQRIASWDLLATLSLVSTDNTLCEALFLIAQRLASRLSCGPVTIWGLFLDGWNRVAHPASGPLAGMLKSIQREYPTACLGTLCTRGLTLSDGLRTLQFESSRNDREMEVVYDHSTRLVRRLRALAPTKTMQPYAKLNAQSVVLATGGARGVTAVMVDSLLQSYGCTVVVIGRSPQDVGPGSLDEFAVEREFYQDFLGKYPHSTPAEMKTSFARARASWETYQTIQQWTHNGHRVEYLIADVSDQEQVAKAVKHVAKKYGPIDFIVHGAGIQSSKRLVDRTLSEFRSTFAVKVAGLYHLVKACRDAFGKVVDTHILTSAYSVFGNDGQHDYGAANETLDRMSELTDPRIGPRWSTIAWLAWDGVGMTTGSEYRALSKQRGLFGMNADLGQQIFREVLSGQYQAAIHIPLTDGERDRYAVRTIPRSCCANISSTYELGADFSKIACLPFHKVRNQKTLPGAWILDQIIHAALQIVPELKSIRQVTIENVSFHRFVQISDGHCANFRLIFDRSSTRLGARLIGNVIHSTGVILSRDLVFAEAFIEWSGRSLGQTAIPSCTDVTFDSKSTHRLSDPYCDARNGVVALSGAFDCLRHITIEPTGRAALFAPDQTCNWRSDIPALLLDAAWRLGAMYANPGSHELYVPIHIRRLTISVDVDAPVIVGTGWEIRSVAPQRVGNVVQWTRTEVVDRDGIVRLTVDDATAACLQ